MMLPVLGASKTTCGLLAVFCGTSPNSARHQVSEDGSKYPIPELVSSGRLEVKILSHVVVIFTAFCFSWVDFYVLLFFFFRFRH